MKFFSLIIIFILNFNLIGNSNEIDPYKKDLQDIFNIGKMSSHDEKFTLFFKSREKAILAKGENFNYITDFPQDLYILDNRTKNIKSPILIMHGKVDNVVPFSMGKKIYELANIPKYSYFTEYDNHMMEYDEKLLNVLKKYIYSLN